jgi:hypothetical protein
LAAAAGAAAAHAASPWIAHIVPDLARELTAAASVELLRD